MLRPVMFDADVAAKKVTLDPDVDQVVNSATNYYDGVTADEVERFYAAKVDEDPQRPVSWGLNSQLARVDGEIAERTWKIDGMYGPAIQEVVHWLEKAAGVAENDRQRQVIDTLIEYYRTGDLRKFDEYNILWVGDLDSHIDFVNGFIEVYSDPLGMKGSWEALVNFKDLEATKRADTISANAQWFEDNSPVDPASRRRRSRASRPRSSPSAMLGGDCYPRLADRHQPAQRELDSQGRTARSP